MPPLKVVRPVTVLVRALASKVPAELVRVPVTVRLLVISWRVPAPV